MVVQPLSFGAEWQRKLFKIMAWWYERQSLLLHVNDDQNYVHSTFSMSSFLLWLGCDEREQNEKNTMDRKMWIFFFSFSSKRGKTKFSNSIIVGQLLVKKIQCS